MAHHTVGSALVWLALLWFNAGLALAQSVPLLELYQHWHRHPELSFHEALTAKRLAAELRALDIAVTEGVGGHGLVGVLRNGDGPTVMLRADMDALPVAEQTGLPYASTAETTDEQGNTVPLMHACGHDVHMTVLVGSARQLVAQRARWSGTVVFVGQPAEERGAGARAMLADGLFERFPRPDFNVAMHVNANQPAGRLGYTPGYALASVDSVDIRVFGVGGHGAYPHMTRDPIVLAAQIVTGLQTLVSRTIAPIAPGVVTVGSIHGGTKHNVIPDMVHLQLTVRAYANETRQLLIEGIRRIAHGQALAMGIPESRLPEVILQDESTPSTYNDPALLQRLLPAWRESLGRAEVVELPPVMGGEDFSHYGRTEPPIPSVLFWMGAVAHEQYAASVSAGESLPSLHSPRFAPDPVPTIDAGVQAMSSAALALLNKRPAH